LSSWRSASASRGQAWLAHCERGQSGR
jgi:hypothetical protein